jgi:DNA modification methylase
MEELVTHYTPVEGHIFDPFTGVGPTAQAAYRQDKVFTGSEIDSEYVNICRQRLFSS